MAAVVQHPNVNGLSGEWWINLCDKLSKVGASSKLQEKYGIDEGHIAEFTFWFMLPFAARHGLPSSQKLESFIVSVEYNLDMDESIGVQLALVPKLRPAMDSSPDFAGFRKFVWENYDENLVQKECELYEDDLMGIAKSLKLF